MLVFCPADVLPSFLPLTPSFLPSFYCNSFVGPSSLYQRWNLHVRHSYGLLQEQEQVQKKKKKVLQELNSNSSSNSNEMMMMKVLVIERKEFRNLWFVY